MSSILRSQPVHHRRTFTNDMEFASRVPEDKLARLLNAFVHEMVRQRSGININNVL